MKTKKEIAEKTYYTLYMGGRIKYTVSKHDGVSKHKDGSSFFDIAIFKNKKNMQQYVNDLEAKGYRLV